MYLVVFQSLLAAFAICVILLPPLKANTLMSHARVSIIFLVLLESWCPAWQVYS